MSTSQLVLSEPPAPMAPLADVYDEAAGTALHRYTVRIILHHNRSAVRERLDRAARQSNVLRAEFEEPVGPLAQAWLVFLNFFRRRMYQQYVVVLDIPAAQTKESPLDTIVKTLGFHLDRARHVRGNSQRVLGQLILSLLVPALLGLARYVPDVLRSSLSEPEQQRLASLFNSYGYHAVALSLTGLLAIALFLLLEWRANLLGWIRPLPQLLDSEQTSEFIAEQIEQLQRRSFVALFLAQILIYLALIPLLFLHLLMFLKRSLTPRDEDDRVKRWRHLSDALINLFIVAMFFFGAAQNRQANRITWSFWPMQEVGNGLIVSSATFLAINTYRTLLKLLARRKLPDRNALNTDTLLGLCILGLLALAVGLGLWLIPEFGVDTFDPIGTIVLILVAHVLLTLVRVWTQSRGTILLRLAEAQRFGDDLERLLDHLLREIPEGLLVLCLWNSDEVPEKASRFRIVEDPHDTTEEVLGELKKYLPCHREVSFSEEQFQQLANYLVILADGVREPYRRFEARLRGLGRASGDVWLWFHALAPRIVTNRLCYYQIASSGTSCPPCSDSWRQPFKEIIEQAKTDWRNNQLPGVPPPSKEEGPNPLPVDRPTQIADLFRWWEEDTWRLHLGLLVRQKRPQYPDYANHLVSLALFASQGGAEALQLEAQRSSESQTGWCAVPSRNLTVALCHQARLFGDLSLVQAKELVQDFQRRGFLHTIDPIEFLPSTLAFLAHAYLTVPELFDRHEQVIRQLTAAGRSDPHFLKAAAEWTRYIQSRTYFERVLRDGNEARLPLTKERRLELTYRAAQLLLDYFETILCRGLANTSAEQLAEELDILSRPSSPPWDSQIIQARQPLSINDSLCKIDERLQELGQARRPHQSKLGPDATPLQLYQRLTEDLKKRWNRLQTQRRQGGCPS